MLVYRHGIIQLHSRQRHQLKSATSDAVAYCTASQLGQAAPFSLEPLALRISSFDLR